MKIENQGNIFHNDCKKTGCGVQDGTGWWINYRNQHGKYVGKRGIPKVLIFKYYML